MGGLNSFFANSMGSTACPSLFHMMGMSLKRKFQDSSAGATENQPTTKKRRLTKYIDKKWFTREQPDITILGLDKVWRLHKIILSQSPYFNCMFNGSWKESSENVIKIEFPDENITQNCEFR